MHDFFDVRCIVLDVLGNLVARPARLERATCGFEVRRSIQLSYGRQEKNGVSEGTRTLGIQDHNLALYQLSYTHHKKHCFLTD